MDFSSWTHSTPTCVFGEAPRHFCMRVTTQSHNYLFLFYSPHKEFLKKIEMFLLSRFQLKSITISLNQCLWSQVFSLVNWIFLSWHTVPLDSCDYHIFTSPHRFLRALASSPGIPSKEGRYRAKKQRILLIECCYFRYVYFSSFCVMWAGSFTHCDDKSSEKARLLWWLVICLAACQQ